MGIALIVLYSVFTLAVTILSFLIHELVKEIETVEQRVFNITQSLLSSGQSAIKISVTESTFYVYNVLEKIVESFDRPGILSEDLQEIARRLIQDEMLRVEQCISGVDKEPHAVLEKIQKEVQDAEGNLLMIREIASRQLNYCTEAYKKILNHEQDRRDVLKKKYKKYVFANGILISQQFGIAIAAALLT